MMNPSPTPGDPVRNLGYHEKRAFASPPRSACAAWTRKDRKR